MIWGYPDFWKHIHTWNPIAQIENTSPQLVWLQDFWTINSMTGQSSSWTLAPPKIPFLGLVPPRKHCPDGWPWHSTLQAGFVGKIWASLSHSSRKNPSLISTTSLHPNPTQTWNSPPSQFSQGFFPPRYIWTNPTFVLPLLPWQIRHCIARCNARKQWLWRTPLGCLQLHLRRNSEPWNVTLVAFHYYWLGLVG